MSNRLDTKERKKILSGATPEFIDKFEEIQTFINDECCTLIKRRYKLGQIAIELSNDKEKYGKKSLETMSKLISVDQAILYRCKALAEKYDDDGVDELISARNLDGDALTWSHISLLTSIEKKETRDKLFQLCLNKCYTVTDLNAEVQKLKGKNRTTTAAKKKPSGIDGFILNIDAALQQLITRANDVWLDDKEGLLAISDKVVNADKAQFDSLDKLSTKIENTIDMLNRVDNAITRTKVRLEKNKTAETTTNKSEKQDEKLVAVE